MPKVGEPISEGSEKLFKTKFHVSWYYIRWFSCREEKNVKTKWEMSLLWKLLAVCSVKNEYGKKMNTDN